jgi:hypothetical protein
VAILAPAYPPRRPTETALYGIVRDNLETFLSWARETYARPLPRYVEQELRAYLRCGVFAHGFVHCRCDDCGNDLLVAFSCKQRGACPSCAGRRMANTAAHLVDRVLPDVPVRQYVLSLPFELRALAAFKPEVLRAMARLFVESIFRLYRTRARRDGRMGSECGAVTFVQRFGGSLNLNVHLHVVVLDGVFVRDADQRVVFHAAPPPTLGELEAIVQRVRDRALVWLRRRGLLDERPLEERSNEAPEPAALDGCAAIAMYRGTLSMLPANEDEADGASRDTDGVGAARLAFAVERDGFNLHAGVRIEADDDLGRERLCRYGARPPLSLERLRRLPGGRVAYRVKYVSRGRAKHRVMKPIELLARLSALIPPPRYPLTRYHGVLAPRSAWRREIVPRAPASWDQVTVATAANRRCAPATASRVHPAARGTRARTQNGPAGADGHSSRYRPAPSNGSPMAAAAQLDGSAAAAIAASRTIAPHRGEVPDVVLLTPNTLSIRHWSRLLGGLLYARSPRLSWSLLLRRTFDVDIFDCAKCHGCLRVIATIADVRAARRILERLGIPSEVDRPARARDPTFLDEELASA